MIPFGPANLVCGLSFVTPQYAVSNVINPRVAAIVSMAGMIGFLKMCAPACLVGLFVSLQAYVDPFTLRVIK